MNIQYCGSSLTINSYRSHSHDTPELVYQLEGEVRTTVGDTVTDIVAGDIIIIPTGVKHSGVSVNGFRDLSVRALEMDLTEQAVIHDHSGDIAQLLFMLQRVMTEADDGYSGVADSILETVCCFVKRELGVSRGSPAVRRMRDILYRNISNEEFELASAIAEIGFDKDYFRRCFKSETGKTPLEYLTALRITHAKQLLERQASFTIESVASSCGFSDSFYFSTCFKKHVGVSPLAYRKRIIEKNDFDT